MKVTTRYGELDLPKAECLGCIAQWRFFACTSCDFTEVMMADAGREYNRIVNETLTQLDETRSE